MKGRKGCVVFFLVLTLALSLWLMLLVQQQRQEAQARTAYYATILEQAPCIENVCPGFNEGRDQALEHLSKSNIVTGKEQGQTIIGLLFSGSKEEIEGAGGIYFTNDSLGNPRMVRRISFRLHDLNLTTVLNTLGELDEFLFISGCGMGIQVHAKLFYLGRGVEIAVNFVTRRPTSEVLTGDTPVHSIEYFSPTDFQNHILESLDWYIMDSVAYDLHPSVTADDFINQVRPWQGISASPSPSADFCPR